MTLAPYAAAEGNSRGRGVAEPPPHMRGEYQRDRDRVIHSAAFRRLEYKTQVFVNHEGDMFRTRLTHTIEVAQIARTAARVLALNEDLVEAVALAHDLGHTPFGHAGQDALNGCLRDFGGFEHNLQSLRVVDVLETKYVAFPGLNLTFETREGILKHCSRANAAQLGQLGERFLHRRQPGLEAQVANVADEIAYNNHDVDDGLRAGLLSIEQLRELPLFRAVHEGVLALAHGLPERRLIPEIIRAMVDRQVTDLVSTSRRRLAEAKPCDIGEVRAAPGPLIGMSEEMYEHHLGLKRFLRSHLYRHYRVHRMSLKSAKIVTDLFEAFFDDPRTLPPDEAGHDSAELSDRRHRARVVADYIAGMTDRYAIAEHGRIFRADLLT